MRRSTVIRIEWLHAIASMERFDEEVRLLKAESERVGKTFRYFANKWRAWGESEADSGNSQEYRGSRAGCWRREVTFLKLAISADIKYYELLRYERHHG